MRRIKFELKTSMSPLFAPQMTIWGEYVLGIKYNIEIDAKEPFVFKAETCNYVCPFGL